MVEAINAGRIPPTFQEDLQARANELVNTVNCPPPTDQGESDEEEKKPNEDKKKEKKESDEELVPLPTVPEDDQ